MATDRLSEIHGRAGAAGHGRMLTFAGLLLLAPVSFALNACDNRAPGDGDSGRDATQRNSSDRSLMLPAAGDVATAAAYLPQAVIGDLYELEAGHVAIARARDPDVRLFAEAMLVDHQRTRDALRDFAGAQATPFQLPGKLDRRHQAMIDALLSASDENFDHVYLDQQKAAHKEALALNRSYAGKGDDPELVKIAKMTAQVIERHQQRLARLSADGAAAPR